MFLRFSISFFFVLMTTSVLSVEPELKVIPGKPAVCEPSTALIVKCPGGGKCLLVGDNEREQRLFLYSIDKASKTLKKIQDVPITQLLLKRIDAHEDIEAMARLSSKSIIVFGSHSRNKKCKLKPKRRVALEAIYKDGKLKKGIK